MSELLTSLSETIRERDEAIRALRGLVAVLREYGTFPPKVLPALQAAERALGVQPPSHAPASALQGAQRDYCPEKLKPGGCQLHNLHCGFPACNQPPKGKP